MTTVRTDSKSKKVVELLRKAVAIERQWRIDAGMSQTDLSEASGVKLSTLRVFERTGRISMERFLRIMVSIDAADRLHEVFLHEPPGDGVHRRARRKNK